jgi:hypothetical protein
MRLADDCVEVVAPYWIPNPEYGENGGLIGVFVLNDDEVVRRGRCDLLESVPWDFRSPPV